MNKQPLRILIIEDSPSQALRLKLLLKRAGYEVCVANDGAEGCEQARSYCPAMILLDINLPTMDGFQVLSLLKHEHTTTAIPVVMLTCFENASFVERAVALGADGYLFKNDCLFRQDGSSSILDTIDQVLRSDIGVQHLRDTAFLDTIDQVLRSDIGVQHLRDTALGEQNTSMQYNRL